MRERNLTPFVTPFVMVFAMTLGLFAPAESTAADEVYAGELTVVISGFASDVGSVKIVLAKSTEGFALESQPVRRVVGEVSGGNSRWVFSELPLGEYAIKIYHDENGNDELDTNFIGIPKEGVGFSNNTSARFGEPRYEDAKFAFDAPSMTIEIEIQ